MLDEDFLPSPVGGSNRESFQWWGLAGLLIGCSILIAATVMMVFTVLFEDLGYNLGVPVVLALGGAIAAMGGVAFLGICGVIFGLRGWNGAKARGESTALGVAGTVASLIGLGTWIAPTVYLIAVILGKS